MFKWVVFIASLTLLFSCSRKDSEEAYSLFRFNLAAPLTSLDPAFASDQPNSWAVSQLYNGLVQLDNRLQIVPAIAKNWELSPDGLTYTFHLRTDVSFHKDHCFEKETRRVVAGDFVYSFNRLLDPSTAARGFWVFDNLVADTQPFKAIDDSTLAIQLRAPFSPFLQRLAMPYCSVVPHEAVDEYGKDFRSHPVGTGPFRFHKWIEGNILILHKEESYFEKDEEGNTLPYIDVVNVRFVQNKSTEFLQFMNRELDFVSDIDASLKDQVLTRDGRLRDEYKDRFVLLKGPYLNVEYLTVLMDFEAPVMAQNPLVFPEVRKAINYSINREEMLLFMRNNRGAPGTGGMVPPSLYTDPLGKDFGYTYDPAKASELLEEAGFPGGVGLPAITLHTTSEYTGLATYLKDKLEDIGLALSIEVVDPRVLRELRVNKETAFFRGSWIADYSDPESYLQMFFGLNGAPPNYSRYSNPAYDSLYVMAVAETDPAGRNLLYRSLDSIMMADAPVIPLYYDEVYRFTRRGIRGLEPDAMNMLKLKYVRMDVDYSTKAE